MPNVILTAEMEGFADACVASGRYADVGEVVGSAMRLLRREENKREALVRSIEEARLGSEEHGYVELEDVLAEMDAIVAEEQRRAGR